MEDRSAKYSDVTDVKAALRDSSVLPAAAELASSSAEPTLARTPTAAPALSSSFVTSWQRAGLVQRFEFSCRYERSRKGEHHLPGQCH